MERTASAHLLRLVVVIAFGLTLGACDKCSFPTWQPNTPPGAPAPPASCHSDSPAPG